VVSNRKPFSLNRLPLTRGGGPRCSPWTISGTRPGLREAPGRGIMAADLIMKAMLYAQLNPCKTMTQLINDRNLYRLVILSSLVLAVCL